MKLQRFAVECYKGFADRTEVELAPLTILVGPNNSGKSALAQAIQLLAGGLLLTDSDDPEPLPLASGGIRHGETFEDLLTGRTAHGCLKLSANLAADDADLSLSASVQNVEEPPNASERKITKWTLRSGHTEIKVERPVLDGQSPYSFSVSGKEERRMPLSWRGLIPRPLTCLPSCVIPRIDELRTWARGVRYLRCPRRLHPSPFPLTRRSIRTLGESGQYSPQLLAADDDLRESVKQWYRSAFGVDLDVVSQGRFFELMARTSTRYGRVRLSQSGRGLSQVLPVAVTSLTATKAGPGVDIIEHPEAELHPAAHAHVAELLLKGLVGPARPMVVETHSSMLLLRARRWIAEGRVPADNVIIYWIHSEQRHGSILRKLRIKESGEMDSWPKGVFIEDYEEIIAIRRAARRRNDLDAHRD